MAYTTEMFKDAVLVNLECRAPGNRRALDDDEFNTESGADKNLLHASKMLVDSEHLRQIHGLHCATRMWLREHAIPARVFRRGCYLIKKTLVEQVVEKFQEAKAEQNELTDQFIDSYPALKADAKTRLKDLYDEKDYPSPERLRRAIGMKLSYVEFGVPEDLKKIDPALYREQKKQAEKEWAQAIEEVKLALRESMQGLIGHMVEKLEPAPDGEKKIIHESSLTKLQKFLDTFQDRDITGDAKMVALTKQAKEVLDGIDLKQLRSDAAFRAKSQQQFIAVKKAVDAMVSEQRTRVIEFED